MSSVHGGSLFMKKAANDDTTKVGELVQFRKVTIQYLEYRIFKLHMVRRPAKLYLSREAAIHVQEVGHARSSWKMCFLQTCSIVLYVHPDALCMASGIYVEELLCYTRGS